MATVSVSVSRARRRFTWSGGGWCFNIAGPVVRRYDGAMGRGPSGYRYPDQGDGLTLRLIADSGLSLAEWEAQESAVLDALSVLLGGLPSRGRLLDFGSGLGRLAIRFAGLFDRVTSIEPDASRAAVQRKHLAAAGRLDQVEVRTAGLDDADVGVYDAAVCSHVVQHVQAAAALAILDGLARALRPGGYLLLLTALAPPDGDRFAINDIDTDGGFIERPVTPDEFDAACRDNVEGRLPVRFFTYQSLIDLLRERGVRPVAAYGFHGPSGVFGPLPGQGQDLPAAVAGCRDLAVLAQAGGG
jgi:SAM-dependent methyltransferase